MKYFILSAGFFISASILFSTRYITSALLALIDNSYGANIVTHQTLSLLVLSILSLILACLFLLAGLIDRNKTKK